jgi:hypothetical protein
MSRLTWTAVDDSQLRQLAMAGSSLTEIAFEMSRGMSTVRARALRLDIAIARDRNGAKNHKPFDGSSN